MTQKNYEFEPFLEGINNIQTPEASICVAAIVLCSLIEYACATEL